MFQQTGRLEEAIGEYLTALKSAPAGDRAEIHNDLGVALARLGRRADAVAHFQEAVRLKPDFAKAQANLAKARAQ